MTFHERIFEEIGILLLIEIASYLSGAILLSFLLNRIALPRLRKRAARNQAAYQRMLVKSLRGELTIWIYSGALIAILNVLESENFIPNELYREITLVILVIVLVSVLWFIKDLADEIISYYARKGRIPQSSLVVNIVKFAIILLIIILVLDQFGISITSIVAALGIGGLALALALQDTLSNVISGLSLVSSRQIQQDEYIELESGESGYVTDISWRNTTIRTLDQELVIIPNSKLSNSTIRNASKPTQEVVLRVSVGVGYESDLEKVEDITLKVAREVVAAHPKGIVEFEPTLLYNDFAASSINFSVLMKVTDFDGRRAIKHLFIKALMKAYREHNINIPFPITTVMMGK